MKICSYAPQLQIWCLTIGAQFKNDGHYFCGAGGNIPDGSDEALTNIPGVGPLIATAVVATMGEASAFKSGREFAAYVGLMPRQTGSGGKIRLLRISKRGDTYLRTLFIHGARAAALLTKEPGPWITELKKRRSASVAIVAMANKLARTVWAIAAHDRKYVRNHVSIRPY